MSKQGLIILSIFVAVAFSFLSANTASAYMGPSLRLADMGLTVSVDADQTISQEIDTSSAYGSAKSDRRKLKRKLRQKKCSMRRQGSKKKQRRCVKKRIKRIDPDVDGIVKKKDNCPAVANNDQADDDGDTVGSACDNCPAVANQVQIDSDSDGEGDACEADVDPSL